MKLLKRLSTSLFNLSMILLIETPQSVRKDSFRPTDRKKQNSRNAFFRKSSSPVGIKVLAAACVGISEPTIGYKSPTVHNFSAFHVSSGDLAKLHRSKDCIATNTYWAQKEVTIHNTAG